MTEEPKKKKRIGRPSLKDKPEVIDKTMQLARAGRTNDEIAEIIGVSSRTISRWTSEDWSFSASLKENKHLADDVVEVSLFRRATGYSHEAEKLFYDAKSKEVVRANTIEHYPPDPTSMIFWLKNRKPKEWRDRVEVANTQEMKLIIDAGDGDKDSL